MPAHPEGAEQLNAPLLPDVPQYAAVSDEVKVTRARPVPLKVTTPFNLNREAAVDRVGRNAATPSRTLVNDKALLAELARSVSDTPQARLAQVFTAGLENLLMRGLM